MKNTLRILIYLSCLYLSAQQRQIVLEWEASKRVGTATKTYNIPYFKGKHFSYADGKLEFFMQWQENQPIDKTTFSLKNIQSQPILPTELYDLPESEIPTGIQPRFSYTAARGTLYAAVSLNPIYKEGGVLKKLVSFDIHYQYQDLSVIKTPPKKISAIAAIENSVLAIGAWYKFYVEKSGVYKIDKSFLSALGMNPSAIDPRKIKIYGQGGRMLPLINQDDYVTGIRENAIQVVGESDGVFNNDDFILFYAIGTDEWNEESQTHRNLFTDKASYFITVEGANGKRIQNSVEPAAPPNIIRTTYTAYQFHEEDQQNIAKIGRRWFGDIFDIETEKNISFTFPTINLAANVTIGVKPASVSSTPTTMQAYINGQQVINFGFPAIPAGTTFQATQDAFSIDGSAFKRGLRFGSAAVTSQDVTIKLTYQKNGNPSAIAYLDYLTVEADCFLTGYGKQFPFTYPGAAAAIGVVAYNFSNASSIEQVWDVTDSYNVSAYPNTSQLPDFSFKAALGEQRNYIAIDENDFYTPSIIQNDKTVPNQNLTGSIFTTNGISADVDYLIITPDFLQQEAQRLANFHQTHSNLTTKVVTLSAIYNELNASNPDIAAIRNFIRYVYENAIDPTRRVKYVCLFGDASVDYKNRLPNNTNVTPVFHAYESFNLTNGIASDDFYAMMDTDEGTLLDNDLMDVAVGRILANTVLQARDMVDKIIAYQSEENQGSWRNSFTLISDDVDASWEGIIQAELDQLATDLQTNKPFINITKIHADSYSQEVSPGGERYPEVNNQLLNSVALGSLVINYFGHGNEEGLAGERLFSKAEAQNLTNKGKYPLFITVTCEFTRFDNPLRETIGELTYWNKEGGAIGLITTTRQIFVGNGITYNNIISQYLFSFGSNEYTSIAEALRLAKIDPAFIGTSQKRVIFYIGDPALKLAIPRPKINLTEVNDVPVAAGIETLQALSLVKMEGTITDEFDNPLPAYNGLLSVSVYDKEIQRQTLANDGTVDGAGSLIKLNFNTLGETVFKGKASINQGAFSFQFVVPKDIAIPVGTGRVSFYAQRENSEEDQTGYSTDIMVGGINVSAPADTTSPVIKLYLNNENFVSGGITNSSPLLLALLNDQNGINTASGIGHDMVAFLDGNEVNPIILNDYYEAETDDYTNGKVRYQLRDLEPGLHTLTFRAWDVYNNASTAEIQFLVLDDADIKLERVLNYPNPFTSYTEFWFHHNKPFEPLQVQIQVFTVSGKIIWTTNQTIVTDGFSREITWDGKDNFGDSIGKGVYVYKITVKSTLTNKQTSRFEKLVIL